MSLELVSTIASVGTFVVIATTAIAAIIQLRHMRGGNQIAALSEMRETVESPEIFAARQFLQDALPAMLKQPGFLERAARRVLDDDLQAINKVGYLFEHLGAFVKYGVIDKEIACDLWSDVVLSCWHSLAPVTAARRHAISPGIFENFEYFAVVCKHWNAGHPNGAYPAGIERMPQEV